MPRDRVVVGAGAAQLLRDVTAALLAEGDELVTPWPSYPLYPLLARRAGARAVPVRGFGVDAVLEAVNAVHARRRRSATPTTRRASCSASTSSRRLLAALPERVIVLLDEALRDFVDAEDLDAALRLVDEDPRLLVVRTFSKAWGLAGLRCGYAVGGQGSRAAARAPRARPRAQRAGAVAGVLEALDAAEPVVRRRAESVAVERRRLADALRGLPVGGPPSQANVVWLAAQGLDGVELARRLERHAVLVAPGGPLGDASHVRVALSRADATDRLLRALEQALAG